MASICCVEVIFPALLGEKLCRADPGAIEGFGGNVGLHPSDDRLERLAVLAVDRLQPDHGGLPVLLVRPGAPELLAEVVRPDVTPRAFLSLFLPFSHIL